MGWLDFLDGLDWLLPSQRRNQPGVLLGKTLEAGMETFIETAPLVQSYHDAVALMNVMEGLRDFKQLWAEVLKDPSFQVVADEQPAMGEYNLVYAAFLDDQLVPQAPRATHTAAMRRLRIYLRGRFEPRHLIFTMELSDRSVRGEIYPDGRWRREVPEILWEASAFKALPAA